MKVQLVLIVYFLTLVVALTSKAEINCTIKGKVIGRDSKNILLHKATEDVRIKGIRIPIVGGSFEYKLTLPVTEAYYLVFEEELLRGFWRPIMFFPENGDAILILHETKDFNNNTIQGGQLNKILADYFSSFNEGFTSRISLLKGQMKELEESGDSLSAKALGKEIEEVYQNGRKWKEKYIEDNSSLVSFSFFIINLQHLSSIDSSTKMTYSRLSKIFPDHPYTKFAEDKIRSLESIKVGGKYIDFSAPDLDGSVIKFSDFHNKQFVLIDFWASWCGPCIETSRTFVPVFEQYKDKGFIILGVARERKDAKAMKRTLQREKYPWLNLIELDDENQIWEKYNLSFSGGGIVLINPKGEVLAINPNAETVKGILEKELSH